MKYPIKEIDKESVEFPVLLKQIGDCPKKLYYIGEWNTEIFDSCVAVVGARKRSRYGKKICDMFCTDFATSGITVVSGFMYGIDIDAHNATLNAGGKTIAVMPCSAEIVHPSYHIKEYKAIAEGGGLIISEYPPNTVPQAWTYPARNRIVAGLSQATLVVEAKKESGSLITAGLTLDYNRELFAVPGPIDSEISEGTNSLIKNGCRVALTSEDILEFYGSKIKVKQLKTFISNLTAGESCLLDFLKEGPLSADEILRKGDYPVSSLGIMLSTMEMKGMIKEESGKYYVV